MCRGGRVTAEPVTEELQRISRIERLPAPRCGLQQGEQFGERAEGFLRDGDDLVLSDRVRIWPVHLPAALALSEDLAPRPRRRRRFPSAERQAAEGQGADRDLAGPGGQDARA